MTVRGRPHRRGRQRLRAGRRVVWRRQRAVARRSSTGAAVTIDEARRGRGGARRRRGASARLPRARPDVRGAARGASRSPTRSARRSTRSRPTRRWAPSSRRRSAAGRRPRSARRGTAPTSWCGGASIPPAAIRATPSATRRCRRPARARGARVENGAVGGRRRGRRGPPTRIGASRCRREDEVATLTRAARAAGVAAGGIAESVAAPAAIRSRAAIWARARALAPALVAGRYVLIVADGEPQPGDGAAPPITRGCRRSSRWRRR